MQILKMLLYFQERIVLALNLTNAIWEARAIEQFGHLPGAWFTRV